MGVVCDLCPRLIAPSNPYWGRQNTQVFPLTSVDAVEDSMGKRVFIQEGARSSYR